MLDKGDHVPRFEIVTIDDIPVNYADLWQKKNLALVCLAEDDSADAQGYIKQLREALPALAVHDARDVLRDPGGVDAIDGDYREAPASSGTCEATRFWM